jgi:hypothetical protein
LGTDGSLDIPDLEVDFLLGRVVPLPELILLGFFGTRIVGFSLFIFLSDFSENGFFCGLLGIFLADELCC